MTALQTLLAGCVDYAGLFPPAALPLPDVVANYAAYRASQDAWALGRLIVPAAQLHELLPVAEPEAPWQVSALLGPDIAADLDRVAAFNAESRGRRLRVDTVELKASTPAAVAAALSALSSDLFAFVEIPLEAEPALLETIAMHGAGAKIRTGGTTPDAFPSAPELLRFLAGCVARGLPFKATAGLHHPLRAEQALNYAADSPRAEMWGFLNVLLATALLSDGVGVDAARALLEERDPGALRLTPDAITWREHTLSSSDLTRARELLRSFGSCSFREPLDDLKAMHLL